MRWWIGELRVMLVWCKAGSPADVEQFLQRYGMAIACAAGASTQNGSKRCTDASDLWHASLLNLMRHAPTLKGMGLGPRLAAFICNTVRYARTNQVKRSSLPAAPRQSVEEGLPAAAPARDDPLYNAILDEYIKTIRQRAATHRGYRALELSLDGMDVKEIATLFGVTEKHLRRIMGTALRKLFGGPSDE